MSTFACPHCNGAISISAVGAAGHAAPGPRPSADLSLCPDHREPWTFKSGISKKNGQAYAFWTCNGRDGNGDYCRRKPDSRWNPPAPPSSRDDGGAGGFQRESGLRDDDPMPF